MRPCRQCRALIDTCVTACSQCGATQDNGPRLNADWQPPARRGWLRQFLADLFEISTALGILFVAFPLAVGGVAGYFLAGRTGMVTGVIAAIVLLAGVMIWDERRG